MLSNSLKERSSVQSTTKPRVQYLRSRRYIQAQRKIREQLLASLKAPGSSVFNPIVISDDNTTITQAAQSVIQQLQQNLLAALNT